MTTSGNQGGHTPNEIDGSAMTSHSIAVIPGDGIGPEVIDAVLVALTAIETRYDITLACHTYDCGSERYLGTGELFTADLAAELRGHDAILFGAMGDPRVAPGILERGFIVAMRSAFRQAVNVRPVRLYPGVASVVSDLGPADCDLIVVRENTEGLYGGSGTTVHGGTRSAVAIHESVNTYYAIRRAAEFAFELASVRRGRLTLCHKKNILLDAGNLWSDVVDEVGSEFPGVEVDYQHVDAMCYHLVMDPGQFDVVVTDNLFGDIITDLGSAVQGGIGASASANLNLDGSAPSMFEPIHGSAPTIAGRGWANPCGALLSASLMLASLGEGPAAAALERATARVLAELPAMAGPDMGASTRTIGERVTQALSDPDLANDHSMPTTATQLTEWIARFRPKLAGSPSPREEHR